MVTEHWRSFWQSVGTKKGSTDLGTFSTDSDWGSWSEGVDGFGEVALVKSVKGVAEVAKSEICKVPEYFVRLFAFIQGFDTLKYR